MKSINKAPPSTSTQTHPTQPDSGLCGATCTRFKSFPRVLQSKIASYRESSKAISQQIFRGLHAAGGGEEASDSQIEKASRCLEMIGTDYTLETPGGGTIARIMGGGHKVAAAGLDGGGGDDQESGRQRHDLSLVRVTPPLLPVSG